MKSVVLTIDVGGIASANSMWCKKCLKHVPEIVSPGGERRHGCALCGTVQDHDAATTPETEELTDCAQILAAIPVDWDDWEFDDELPGLPSFPHSTSVSNSNASVAPALFALPYAAPASLTRQRERRADQPSAVSTVLHALSWTVLSLSLMVFMCGAVLVSWSFFADRSDLWRLGMPLTLVGQTGWLVGMVFQIDGLWRRHRETTGTLGDLNRQIDELRHAATLLTTARGASGQSFYAHLAEGASPNLLLADLKGQLDLLAMQLERRNAA